MNVLAFRVPYHVGDESTPVPDTPLPFQQLLSQEKLLLDLGSGDIRHQPERLRSSDPFEHQPLCQRELYWRQCQHQLLREHVADLLVLSPAQVLDFFQVSPFEQLFVRRTEGPADLVRIEVDDAAHPRPLHDVHLEHLVLGRARRRVVAPGVQQPEQSAGGGVGYSSECMNARSIGFR